MPGSIIIGADSHSCSHGCVGALAMGMGASDTCMPLITSKTWLKVPEVIQIKFIGEPSFGIVGKDVILHILNKFGRNTIGLQRVVEFTGNIKNLTIVKKDSEWIIQTSGSNLGKVFKIPGVDTTRTTTNNIWEIAAVIGIEAARSTLINEITHTLDEQGLEVDIRHIVLVSDLMSSTGMLKSIGRHGIAGTKESVLARAAFEITVPTISKASVSGEIEELKGVTENVIVGLPVPVGTGMIELYMKR